MSLLAHAAMAAAVLLFPVIIRPIGPDQKPIEAEILIQSSPGRERIVSGKTTDGEFVLKDIGKFMSVYVVIYPTDKSLRTIYKTYNVRDLMNLKELRVDIPRRGL